MTPLPVHLRRDGVLWAVNRVLFHPRGFALAKGVRGGLYLHGDGTSPLSFGMVDMEDEKLAAFEALLDRARPDGG